jgi:hypothetical protein
MENYRVNVNNLRYDGASVAGSDMFPFFYLSATPLTTFDSSGLKDGIDSLTDIVKSDPNALIDYHKRMTTPYAVQNQERLIPLSFFRKDDDGLQKTQSLFEKLLDDFQAYLHEDVYENQQEAAQNAIKYLHENGFDIAEKKNNKPQINIPETRVA